MRISALLLFSIITIASSATDFYIGAFESYNIIVYGKVNMPSSNQLELEIVETIKLGEARLERGMKISIPYYNYQYDLTEERDAVLALSLSNGKWRVEHMVTGSPENNNSLSFKNRLGSVTTSVKEFAEGLKLLYSDLIIHPHPDKSINYRQITISLKVDEEQLKKDVEKNAFFAHLFHEWDFYRLLTPTLGFGFWIDLQERTDSLIQKQGDNALILYEDSNASAFTLFTRFQSHDEEKRLLKELVYYFDPLSEVFRKVYAFTPDEPCLSSSSEQVWLNNMNFFGVNFRYYGGDMSNYHTSERPSYFFGDFYLNPDSRFSYGEHRQLLLPKCSCSGILNSYSSCGDSLFAQITDGKFNGMFEYYSADRYFVLNFNEQGQKNGACAMYTRKMGKLVHYEHYSNGLRSGHYLAQFSNGQTYLSGSYHDNQRIGTWLEYYPPEEGGRLKSKNNYGFYDNSIEAMVSDKWTVPKILSNRCIDANHLRTLHGYQIYYDPEGATLSLQKWNNGELNQRQDWYTLNLKTEETVDSSGRIVIISHDTLYHTVGKYQDNQPWSGTFLVGANDLFYGSASGRGPYVCISIDSYENGLLTDSDTLFSNLSIRSLPYISQPFKVNEADLYPYHPKKEKKGLFRKKKKYRTTAGGNIIEIVDEPKKKKKKAKREAASH